MQSTGQTSTHDASLTPMHGSTMTYVMAASSLPQRAVLALLGNGPAVGPDVPRTDAAEMTVALHGRDHRSVERVDVREDRGEAAGSRRRRPGHEQIVDEAASSAPRSYADVRDRGHLGLEGHDADIARQRPIRIEAEHPGGLVVALSELHHLAAPRARPAALEVVEVVAVQRPGDALPHRLCECRPADIGHRAQAKPMRRRELLAGVGPDEALLLLEELEAVGCENGAPAVDVGVDLGVKAPLEERRRDLRGAVGCCAKELRGDGFVLVMVEVDPQAG